MPLVLDPIIPTYRLWFPGLFDEGQGGDKVVDVREARAEDGAFAQTWWPNGSKAQDFVLDACGDGIWRVVNAYGRVLDCGKGLGEPMVWWPWNRGPHQQWLFERVKGTGEKRLYVARSLVEDWAVDVKDFGKGPGTPLVAWHAHGDVNQQVEITDRDGNYPEELAA